jgi:hypothetical protein
VVDVSGGGDDHRKASSITSRSLSRSADSPIRLVRRRVATTTLDAPFRLPSVRRHLDFVRSSASPVQQVLGRLEPAAADAAWAEIEERLAVFATSDGWVGPNELLLTAGRR